jgi:hypothetical protein
MECTRCSGTVLSLLYMRATMYYYIISYSHNKVYNDLLLFVHLKPGAHDAILVGR